jgi:triacylglycerol esterase/lipase EstA (alpha/beta hydrolase family)
MERAKAKQPGLARFIAGEALAYALHAALLPFGARIEPNADVSPLPGESPAVLLVHGHGGGTAQFGLLERALARAGFDRRAAWGYRSSGTVDGLVADLDAFVRRRLGDRPVHLIGHSLGGVIGRLWLQERGGRAQARSLVTLSTPHRGIASLPGARLLPLVRELLPGSDVLRRLEAGEGALEGLPCLSVVSTRDHFVRPVAQASFGRARLVEITSVGHVGMLFSSEVHRLVTDHLSLGGAHE